MKPKEFIKKTLTSYQQKYITLDEGINFLYSYMKYKNGLYFTLGFNLGGVLGIVIMSLIKH